MGYVIAAILVVLIVGGFIMFLVTNSARSNVSDAGDPGRDSMPVGDTEQHAGEQTEAGETVAGQDAEAHGGTGEPQTGYAGTGEAGSGRRPDDEHVARPVVGGEAEGERQVD